MARVHTSSFGELLRRYRTAAGLTQDALADRAALAARTISDLERGVASRPHRHTVRLLTDALGLSERDRVRLDAAAADHLTLMQARNEVGERETVVMGPPLVGRTGEMEALEHHISREGPPLLMLAGEPGIGKTRLLREAEQYAMVAAMTVLQGGCQRRSAQEPFAPIVEALSDYIDRQPAARLPALLEGCSWLIRLLPELAEVLPTPPNDLHPTQERRLQFRAVIRFLRNAAEPGGVLLTLDDLQWAGTDALDLLGTLVRAAPEVPLRVISAYRDTEIGPEGELNVMLADLARSDRAVHRSLRPLLPDEAIRLLSALVGRDNSANTSLQDQILRRAGGVPFFLVSYAQGLREDGLDLSDRRHLPWTTTQSIRQRVASLPQDAREVLKVAAVAGRVVSQGLVVAAAEQEEAAVVAGLDVACRARLLEAQPGHMYRFTHDLIREVIEADLGAAQRTVLHRHIGRAQEQIPDQQRGRYVAELAWHLREGDEPGRALPYAILAGVQAEAVYAYREAEHHYRIALELALQVSDTARQAEALEKLGFALLRMGRLTEAHEVSKQAAQLYHAMHNLEGEARTLTRTAGVQEPPSEGIARIRQLLGPLQARGPSPILAQLHENMAWLHRVNGRYGESLAAAERACELARAINDERLFAGADVVRGDVLVQLGQIQRGLEVFGKYQNNWAGFGFAGEAYTVIGELEEAKACFQRSLAMVEQLGVPATHARYLGLLSSHLCLLADWQGARMHVDAAEAILRSVEMHWDEPLILCLRVRGQLRMAEGQWAEAAHYLKQCIAVCERPGNVKHLAQAHMELAELDLLQGHADLVRTRLEKVLERSDLSEANIIGLTAFLAWAHAEMHEVRQAETLAELAVKRATAAGMRLCLVDALRVRGMVERQRGRWCEAERTFRDALELTRTLGHSRAEGWILYEIGLNGNLEGNRETALQRWEEALALAHRLNLGPLVERSEQAISRMQ